MGISILRSLSFFAVILICGVMLFPSGREMGKLFTESGAIDKARFYLEKQFHNDPSDTANTRRYLDSMLLEGQLSLVERAGRRLLTIYPDDIAIIKILAELYENNMDYDKASIYWLRVLQLDHQAEETRQRLLSYYIAGKHHDKLMSLYEQRVRAGSVGADMYYGLARLYAVYGRQDDAAAIYSRMLLLFPGETAAKIKMAQYYEYKDQIQDAISIYSQIVEENPQDVWYAFMLLDRFRRYKKYEEALKALELFVLRFPDNDSFIMSLSDIYIRMGRGEDALQLLQRSYERDPDNHRVIRSIGEIYFDMKDYTNALEALRIYHDKTGGDYRSHHVLGDIYSAIGDAAGSEREYRKALELIRAGR